MGAINLLASLVSIGKISENNEPYSPRWRPQMISIFFATQTPQSNRTTSPTNYHFRAVESFKTKQTDVCRKKRNHSTMIARGRVDRRAVDVSDCSRCCTLIERKMTKSTQIKRHHLDIGKEQWRIESQYNDTSKPSE
jgi:hypothetical protein